MPFSPDLQQDRKDHQFSLLEIAFATAATFGSEREDSVRAVGKYAENRASAPDREHVVSRAA